MIPGKGIYDSLPVWAQTLAVNLTSSVTFRRKYGRVFHEELARLAANEKKSFDQLLHEQQQTIKQLLRYAVKNVPYYREGRFSPDNFSEWPLLDKATVAKMPEKFVSDEFSLHRLAVLQTSGTTGTPLTVRFTNECHQTEMAFRWRHKAWGGVPFLSRSAYLSGHPVVPSAQTEPPFWRVDQVERRLLCSSYHFTAQNLPHYADALAGFAPDFLHGYPSSLFVLAQHVLERGEHSVRPRVIYTGSETLLDFQRAVVERAFGAKVFNWYGNTEMTGNIVECAYGSLHYRMDYGLIELQADGEIVATGLFNRAMPLIRYRTGDVATAQAGTCECGCAFPLIEHIAGRIEDYIRTPDGRTVGRLDHIFKGVEHVREAQIVQRQTDELQLRIVRVDGFTSDDEGAILAAARERLGPSIRLRCEYVDAIERTAAGKFCFVVTEER